MANTINADNGVSSGTAGLKSTSDGTGILALQTNGTTALTVDASQNVSLTNALAVTSGGTGATSNAAAPFALKGANSDITSLTGLTTPLSVAQGGTGVTSSTGSGANVLGTSPTLTTPTINSAQVATVSGTAPLYFARAWVNFNGTGTVAIRASGNVTSITDNSAGNYTVNLTTAISDANYSVKGMASLGTRFAFVALSSTAQTTSAVSIVVYGDDGSLQDCAQVHVSIVR